MEQTLIEEYKKHRNKSYSAVSSFSIAKTRKDTEDIYDWHAAFRPEGTMFKATWEKLGLNYEARIVLDDDMPFIHEQGKWTNENERGALRNPSATRDEYEYWIPETSEEEHYTSLREMKYGKYEARRLAHKYVMEDFKRVKSYGTEWVYIGLVVTIYKEGIRLGQSSLWGIDFELYESDFRHINECVKDVAEETLSDVVQGLGGKIEEAIQNVKLLEEAMRELPTI